jgi:hypothetical protein
MSRIRKIVYFSFHPLFFGLYPALFFLSQNYTEIDILDSVRTFIVVLISVCLLFLVLIASIRNKDRAAIVCSICICLFFSYGHIYGLTKSVDIFGFVLGRHRYLIVIYLVVFILGMRWAFTRKELSNLTYKLNLFSFLLCMLPVLHIFSLVMNSSSPAAQTIEINPASSAIDPDTYPDIYYIIPDAYTRDDALLEMFSFDNSEFLTALEDRGFYIARCSLSNYAWTRLSVGSSMNFDYIQNIITDGNFRRLDNLVQDNLVFDFFHRMGYTIITFETAFPPTSLMHHVDQHFSYQQKDAIFFRGLREFEALFFRTTAGLIFLDVETLMQDGMLKLVDEFPKRDRYERIEYNIDQLETVPYMPGPKFVFAHINIPHEPYIFAENGEFVPNQTDPIQGYRQQIAYVNSRLLSIVDIILAQSDQPPVILIQGDHGSVEAVNDFRRMQILSAYYLPDEGLDLLYPTISPVNTFRLILDTYFGREMDLLPDISYYSHWKKLSAFDVVPISRQGCSP